MKENLFFALAPDFQTATSIEERFKNRYTKAGFSGRPIAAERLHVSLYSVGEYQTELAQAISRIAEEIRFEAFHLILDRAMTFRNRSAQQPFVLTTHDRLEKLRAFHRQLAEALNQNGFDLRIERTFKPHLTLIWDSKIISEYQLRKPVSWTVREFVLIRSFVGQSRYEFVGRWPLHT